jgi:small subunit ribosomal protein S8
VKRQIAEALKREGFIEDFKVVEGNPADTLRVYLKKESGTGRPVIRSIERISKPGCRVYLRASEVKPVLQGMGVSVVSTSKGVLSDRECRRENVGGEVLCRIW